MDSVVVCSSDSVLDTVLSLGLWTPKDIATALDKNPATVRWLFSKMTQSETSRVAKHSHGKYCHTSRPHYKGDELLVSPTHPTNSSEEDRESLSGELDDPPTLQLSFR